MTKKQLFTQFPVTAHTDYVGQGTIFVVIKGLQTDGALYVKKALERGAKTIVIQEGQELLQDVHDAIAAHGATVQVVENARKSLALLSAQAAGYPAKKLKIFAVGGTKGKTTTVAMLGSMLRQLGKKVAFVTTAFISMYTDKDELAEFDCEGTLTTPQPDYLQQFLKLCVDKGVEYVVLEVAVQAHTFFRIEGIEFDGVIFTNLDREHAELYPSMEDYFQEKCILFTHLKSGAPLLVNADDLYGQRILNRYLKAKSFNATSLHNLSVATLSDYKGILVEDLLTMQSIQVLAGADAIDLIYSGFPGVYNLSNFVSAYALLTEVGLPVAALEQQEMVVLQPVPGRLEMQIAPNGAIFCIDYAHTASSFEHVLSLMRTRTNDLRVVFGAGGNKDQYKRPLMGEVAARIADLVFVTDDNPRFEDSVEIIKQIVSGVPQHNQHKVIVEHDREQAIKRAYEGTMHGSIIMLLGKGPDQVQLVQGKRLFFSEKQVLQSL